MTRRTKRNVDPDIVRELEKLHGQGFQAKQVYQELTANELLRGRVPSLRTVQRMVADRTPPDESGPWQLEAAVEADSALVISVLGATLEASQGRTRQITKAEALWITAIHEAAPSLPASDHLLRFARIYIGRRGFNKSTLDLDAFLAYRPWERAWQHHAYVANVLLRRIPPPLLQVSESYWRFPPFPAIGVCASEEGWCDVVDVSIDEDCRAHKEDGILHPLYQPSDAVPFLRFLREWALAQREGPDVAYPQVYDLAQAFVTGSKLVGSDDWVGSVIAAGEFPWNKPAVE